jgi:hypothetical protein
MLSFSFVLYSFRPLLFNFVVAFLVELPPCIPSILLPSFLPWTSPPCLHFILFLSFLLFNIYSSTLSLCHLLTSADSLLHSSHALLLLLLRLLLIKLPILPFSEVLYIREILLHYFLDVSPIPAAFRGAITTARCLITVGA